MAFIRFVVFGFIVLSVVYCAVSLYSRSVRKERLENDFDEMHPDGADADARDLFVADGIRAYNNSIRPKLIGLIYVVPVVVVAAIAYTINAN